MSEGLLLAFSAALVYGVLGITFEVAGKRHYKVWDVIFVKQFTGLCIGLACALFLRLPLFDRRLCLLGLIGAVAYFTALSAYLVASREKTIAVNWTILNLSVVVPILLSVVWFGDHLTSWKIVGILCTVLSIALIGGASGGPAKSEKTSSRWLVCISIAFLLNGVLVILFRFVPDGKGALFTAYFYGISFVFAALYKLIADRNWRLQRGLIGVSTAGAATHWSGMMLTMAALVRVGQVSKQSGVIVYPITNGLVIPIGVILGVFLLKQKMNMKTTVGVVIGVAALVCLFLP